jgi:hypothetical protein
LDLCAAKNRNIHKEKPLIGTAMEEQSGEYDIVADEILEDLYIDDTNLITIHNDNNEFRDIYNDLLSEWMGKDGEQLILDILNAYCRIEKVPVELVDTEKSQIPSSSTILTSLLPNNTNSFDNIN